MHTRSRTATDIVTRTVTRIATPMSAAALLLAAGLAGTPAFTSLAASPSAERTASTLDHGLVLPLDAATPEVGPAASRTAKPRAATTRPTSIAAGGDAAGTANGTNTANTAAVARATDAADAANANGFAFYPGTWHIKNRKLKTRLAGSQEWIESEATDVARAVLDGRGVIAEYSEASAATAYKGMSVYLYDPAVRQWRLFWADGRSGRMDPPLAGRFADGRGEFFGDDQHDGRPIKVRFRWSSTGARTAHWEQAFSADQGKTWETNWIMELTRVK